MVKKTLTYPDFNGENITKDHYFNLSKMEFRELDREIPGGLQNLIDQIRTEKDTDRMLDLLTTLVLASYGEKAEDGRFVKEDRFGRKLSSFFKITEAWDVLFTNLVQNEGELEEFLIGIIPKDMVEGAKEQIEKEKANLNKGSGNLTPLNQK